MTGWPNGSMNNVWTLGPVDGMMDSMWSVMYLDERLGGWMDGWVDR